MKGRRGTRREQLMDDLKENKEELKLKEEELDPILWGTCCGRAHGPLIRQAALMNEAADGYCLWHADGVVM